MARKTAGGKVEGKDVRHEGVGSAQRGGHAVELARGGERALGGEQIGALVVNQAVHIEHYDVAT